MDKGIRETVNATANFYNFMDGINGIAGLTGLVGFGLFMRMPLLRFIIAGDGEKI